MVSHLITFACATALFILLALLGVLIDLLGTPVWGSGGEAHSGIGVSVGSLVFVFLWYHVIRKHKPVWQPGRRYWHRWLWILLVIGIIIVTEIGMSLLLHVSLVGIASFVWFIIDAIKNPRDFCVTETALIEE
jgi:hypothetical protein